MKTDIQNNHGSFGYRGTIKIQVRSANKVLETHTYHNAGLEKFFNELCTFLTGGGNARNLLPNSIILYSLDDCSNKDDYLVDSAGWETLWNENVLKQVSKQTTLDTRFVRLENDRSVAIFQVSLPYVDFLYSTQGVHIMALYPKNIEDMSRVHNSALAYYKLKDASSWQPIEVNKSSADLNLLIEWQMDFANVNR